MDEDVRETARKRIKAKREFWNTLMIFGAILAVCNLVWLISGYRTYYWPAWPLLGFAIATVFSAINVFGSRSRAITDQQIDRELGNTDG